MLLVLARLSMPGKEKDIIINEVDMEPKVVTEVLFLGD